MVHPSVNFNVTVLSVGWTLLLVSQPYQAILMWMGETNSGLCKSAHLETSLTHLSIHCSTLPRLLEEPSCAISRHQLYNQRLGREPSFSTHQGRSRADNTGWVGPPCHSELLPCFQSQGEDGPWAFSAHRKLTLFLLSLSSAGWHCRSWLSSDFSSKPEVLAVISFCFLSSSSSWMRKWRHSSNLFSKTWSQRSHTWGFSLVSTGWGSEELPSPASWARSMQPCWSPFPRPWRWSLTLPCTTWCLKRLARRPKARPHSLHS